MQACRVLDKYSTTIGYATQQTRAITKCMCGDINNSSHFCAHAPSFIPSPGGGVRRIGCNVSPGMRPFAPMRAYVVSAATSNTYLCTYLLTKVGSRYLAQSLTRISDTRWHRPPIAILHSSLYCASVSVRTLRVQYSYLVMREIVYITY